MEGPPTVFTPSWAMAMMCDVSEEASISDIINLDMISPEFDFDTGYTRSETEQLLTQHLKDEEEIAKNPPPEIVYLEAEQRSLEWFLTREAKLTASVFGTACNVGYIINVFFWFNCTNRCAECAQTGVKWCWHCTEEEHHRYGGCKWCDQKYRLSCDECVMDGIYDTCEHYCRGKGAFYDYQYKVVSKWGQFNPRVQWREQESTRDLERGTLNEHRVNTLTEMLLKLPQINDGLLSWHADAVHIGDSPDGLAMHAPTGRDLVFEYKCPRKAKPEIKPEYVLQMVAHMFIQNKSSCIFVTMDEENAYVYRVFRTLEAWQWLKPRLDLFYLLFAGIYMNEPEFQKYGPSKEWFESKRAEFGIEEELPFPPSLDFALHWERHFGKIKDDYRKSKCPQVPAFLIAHVDKPHLFVGRFE